MDLNSIDESGTTPLHWAMHEQAEVSLSYLLAWDIDINKQDLAGQTPFHLAVRCAADSHNVRFVRIMSLRGARRDIRDQDGKRPIDH